MAIWHLGEGRHKEKLRTAAPGEGGPGVLDAPHPLPYSHSPFPEGYTRRRQRRAGLWGQHSLREGGEWAHSTGNGQGKGPEGHVSSPVAQGQEQRPGGEVLGERPAPSSPEWRAGGWKSGSLVCGSSRPSTQVSPRSLGPGAVTVSARMRGLC